MPLDARRFLDRARAILARHAVGESGVYARWTLPGADRAPNPYGASDAANLLYTLDEFPDGVATRAAWVAALRHWQEPETGLFREATHDPIHTTAHCMAALELFDALPAHRLTELAPLREAGAMEEFLDALDWAGRPWTESHRGAGLYAALHLAGESSPAWEARYFAWLGSKRCRASGFRFCQVV